MLPIYGSMHALPYNKHLLVSLLWNANALKVVAYFICLRISEPSAFKEFCLYSLNQWFCLVEMNCYGHTSSGLCKWQGMVMEWTIYTISVLGYERSWGSFRMNDKVQDTLPKDMAPWHTEDLRWRSLRKQQKHEGHSDLPQTFSPDKGPKTLMWGTALPIPWAKELPSLWGQRNAEKNRNTQALLNVL